VTTPLTITVHGIPGPQGSKKPLGTRRTKNGGITTVMVESSAKVKPWRQDVTAAALEAIAGIPDWKPLDGPLVASVVFTMRHQPTSKPAWWPAGLPWSRKLTWRPASTPDLSKLLRSTEDALTGVAWKDDARVVEYVRLAKYYVGHPATDVLPHGPGAVIRVWPLDEAVDR
jgi:Holliday junction resolvase RusA-like endonuclease